MSSKKKLIISLSVAAAVLVAAIIAIVAVFAASAQTVKSTVKISFTATDVDGSISATYQIKNAEKATPIGSATFKAADATASGDLVNKEVPVQLTSKDDSVEFVYTFKNDGQRHMKIELEQLKLGANLVAEYQVVGLDDDYVDDLRAVTLSGKATPEALPTEAVIKITISVVNKAWDIEETSIDFSWTMTAVTTEANLPVVGA